MWDILQRALNAVTDAAKDFVGILSKPRSYGKEGRLFHQSRWASALGLLALSVVVTMLAKRDIAPAAGDVHFLLARDLLWKFIFVICEAGPIILVGRLLRHRWVVRELIVANCFYFATLSLIGRVALLLLHGLGWACSGGLPHGLFLRSLGLGLGMTIGAWGGVAWLAYTDRAKIQPPKAWVALTLVLLLSAPVLYLTWQLRAALGLHSTCWATLAAQDYQQGNTLPFKLAGVRTE